MRIRTEPTRLTALLTTLLAFSLVSQPTAAAAQGGAWLDNYSAVRESNRMNSKHILPATIDCRFKSITPRLATYEVKFSYEAKPSQKRGHWQVGNTRQMAQQDAIQRKRGYHTIFMKRIYDRASGERASCAIWRE
ncbi:hypothetical protein NKH53_31715 [Mesorhizobium australicum]|uniref:hypothetical protein n=1 Tax=Mesorhizobium australicum TaxID=536018 RepID=UPI00333CE226